MLDNIELLNEIIDNSPSWICINDVEGKFIKINKTLAKALNQDEDQIIGKTYFDVFNINQAEEFHRNHIQVITSGKSLVKEITKTDFLNEIKWIKTHKHPYFNADGKLIGVISYAVDYSEEKKLLGEAKKGALILNQAPLSIVITDSFGCIKYVNPAFTRVTGYSFEEAFGRNPKILSSGQTPRKDFDDLWNTIRSGEIWRGRLINKKKDGTRYYEASIIAPIFSDEGAISEFIAIKEDITEQILAEMELEKLRDEQEMILDMIPAWIFYKNMNNRFLNVNRTFADVMNMKKEDLIGASCNDLYPKEQAEAFLKDDLEVIATGLPKPKIIESMDSPDGLKWVQTEKIPYKDKDGQIIGILGFALDITERKKMEDEIRKLSITDQLTGLYNRRGFLNFAEHQFKIAERTKSEFLIMSIDIDGLKIINDTLGHAIGDVAIIETADVLRELFRPTDIVARVGGDEFNIVLYDTSLEYAEIIKQRLVMTVSEYNSRENRKYKLSLSYGVSSNFSKNVGSLENMLVEADDFMYECKRIHHQELALM